MVTGKKMLTLANVETVQDKTTGDRTKKVTLAKRLIATVELVGIQTAQLGQMQGFNLSFSIEIGRVYYSGEKYIYFDGAVYEVKSLSKAKEPTKMLLNVQRLDDLETKTAIEEWLNDLQQEAD